MELIDITLITDTQIDISEKDINNYFLKKSIETYGQLRPIIINENNEIIDGHKLFRICKSLSYSQVYIKKINISLKEQLYCELNLINSKLNSVEVFKYIKNFIDINNNCLPFSKQELQGFIQLLDFSWDNFDQKNKKSLF
jgi:hypothetical protein